MDTETIWAGLDLGLRETRVCLVNDEGAPIHEQTCETSPEAISAALSAVPQDRIRLVAAEAGAATHVVRKLREANFPVAVFEARKASKFLAVRRNKTDAGDARGLADLARLGRHTVSQIYLKSLGVQQLRTELAIRQKIVRLRVVADGALRSRLAVYGKRFVWQRNPALIRDRVMAQVTQLKAEEGIDLEDSLAPLVDACVNLRSYQQKLERQFEKFADEHAVCRRLMEVPGVGPICAISFYTAIEDPTRFDRNCDVAAPWELRSIASLCRGRGQGRFLSAASLDGRSLV